MLKSKSGLTLFQARAIRWMVKQNKPLAKSDFGRQFYSNFTTRPSSGIRDAASFAGGSVVKILLDKNLIVKLGNEVKPKDGSRSRTPFFGVSDYGKQQLEQFLEEFCECI